MISYRRTYPALTRAGRQGSDPSERQDDLPAARLLVPWLPWTWVRAAARLRRDAPEVVVIQWWHPIAGPACWYIARRARKLGARVTFVCHNAVPHEEFPLARTLTRLALGTATRVIALSEGVAAELRALLPDHEIAVIPHPAYMVLSADETYEARVRAWREKVACPPGTRVVLFFGNVRPYKGVSDLVEASSLVTASVPAVLIVAGTFFEPIGAYRRQIERLGLADAVRLVDEYIPNEDVAALFAISDLVVLPYRSASQSGIVPLAAMFGKPVVATDVGALPNALAGTGIVVPPSDPQALGDAIIRALRTPPLPPPVQDGVWTRWREAIVAP